MTDTSVSEVFGRETTAAEESLRLARLAKKAGCDGVVCSGCDIEVMRSFFDDDFTLIVPGVILSRCS